MTSKMYANQIRIDEMHFAEIRLQLCSLLPYNKRMKVNINNFHFDRKEFMKMCNFKRRVQKKIQINVVTKLIQNTIADRKLITLML